MSSEAIVPIIRGEHLEVFGRDFTVAQRMAMALSQSSMVPKAYQGKDAIGNCLVALDMASRLGMSPLAVMQKMYVVGGKPAFEATFVIAAVNGSGKFTPLRFSDNGKEGDEYGVFAIATDKETGEALKGTTITWQMVDGEGWSKKDGSKWKTMPEQMFKYRAASFWQREHCPELTMGVMATDEIEDIEAQSVVIREDSAKGIDAITEKLRNSVIEINEAKKIFGPEKTSEPKASTSRSAVIEAARKLWGEDQAMPMLAQLCRQKGFALTSATEEQASEVLVELEDRIEITESESEEK
jgi:hypothetical protein